MIEKLTDAGILGGSLEIRPLARTDASTVGQLRISTRDSGLSLGDRCCLAVASRLKLPAYTADGAWADLGLDIDVRIIRDRQAASGDV